MNRSFLPRITAYRAAAASCSRDTATARPFCRSHQWLRTAYELL